MKNDILSALCCILAFIVCIFFLSYGYKWMGDISLIPLGGFCIYVYKAIQGWRERNDEEDAFEDEPAQDNSTSRTDAPDDVKPDTKNIAYAALKRLGCSPKELDERGFIYTFQGFNFIMDFDETFFARTVLLPTPVCRKSDVVAFMELQEVLNFCNRCYPNSFFWVEMDDSDGKEEQIGVMIKDSLLLHPKLPDAQKYIASQMGVMIKENYEVLDIMKNRRANKENGTKESTESASAEN